MAHQAGAYPGFCSKKQLGVFLFPPVWDTSPSEGYTKFHLGFEGKKKLKNIFATFPWKGQDHVSTLIPRTCPTKPSPNGDWREVGRGEEKVGGEAGAPLLPISHLDSAVTIFIVNFLYMLLSLKKCVRLENCIDVTLLLVLLSILTHWLKKNVPIAKKSPIEWVVK